MPKSQKQKILRVWEKVSDDQRNIANLKKLDLIRRDVSVNKKTRELILAKGHLITNDEQYTDQAFALSYFLKNFKEWMLPYFHPMTKIYTTPAYIVNERLIFVSSYYWKQISGGYNFHFNFAGQLTNIPDAPPGGGGGGIIIFHATPPIPVPLYVDVKLVTFNENVWQEVQQLKD